MTAPCLTAEHPLGFIRRALPAYLKASAPYGETR